MTIPARLPHGRGAKLAPSLFVILWASGFMVARLTAGHVEPLTFLAYRFPLALLAFVLIAWITGASWPNRSLAGRAAVSGMLIHGTYLGPIYWAVAHGMPAAVAALIVGLQPLITAFIAKPVLHEPIDRRHWLGLLIGLLGVALVLEPKLSFTAVRGITPLTSGLCLLGTFSVSMGTVYQKRYVSAVPLAAAGVFQYLGASLIVITGATFLENFGFDGSFQAWFGLGWAVIVLSVGAILMLMTMIRHGSVGKVSSVIFLVPATTALMTYLFFGESLNTVQIIGMVLCAAAVFAVTHKA